MDAIPADPMSTLACAGPPHWGVMLAQGWKGELRDSALAPAETALEWATACEELGFDGIWVFDHFVSYPARAESPVLEAWTTLGALSRHTARVVIGTLVSCAGYRYPQITARMATTLTTLSGGRFCLGLGAGWDEEEFRLMAIPFPSPATRSALLAETAAVCRRASAAHERACAPLLIGGEGEQRTLRTAARFADLTNWQVGVESFRRKSAVLREWCSRSSRDINEIRRTHAANVKIFASAREFRQWKQNSPGGMSSADVDRYIHSRGAFYGTTESIVETIAGFVDAGCGGFMLFCNDAPYRQVLGQLSALRPIVSLAACSRRHFNNSVPI